MHRTRASVALLCCLAVSPAVAQTAPNSAADFQLARLHMVEKEIAGAGVQNPRVLDAMRTTPRHEFMPVAERGNAYLDMALPIGEGQTISPPFIVAYMTEQIDPQPTDKVLEIGTGSGYQAAILSPLVKDVYTIEIKPKLGQQAARTLKRLGYKNVHTQVGDGFQGWPDAAPFDKIIVTCSPEKVPQPLVDQLREGGRMIIPKGERYQQTLYLFEKQSGELKSLALLPTLFVPMTGQAEDNRVVKPDPAAPRASQRRLRAGSRPAGRPPGTISGSWPGSRTARRPKGEHYVTFRNEEAGPRGPGLARPGHRRPQDSRDRAVGLGPRREHPPRPATERTSDGARSCFTTAIGGNWRPISSAHGGARSIGSTSCERIKVPPKAMEANVFVGLVRSHRRVVGRRRAADADHEKVSGAPDHSTNRNGSLVTS